LFVYIYIYISTEGRERSVREKREGEKQKLSTLKSYRSNIASMILN
jgi:hypothetical protein